MHIYVYYMQIYLHRTITLCICVDIFTVILPLGKLRSVAFIFKTHCNVACVDVVRRIVTISPQHNSVVIV